ncbi:MAG: lytic transglycosylase domain-containing protein [Sideroxyarcus sp.]|nr:lytic transglycosylase domain-containing protein [Sideroxyarcus sp.]
MKALGGILLCWALPLAMVAGLLSLNPALASVYTYTMNNGTVNLSNVPVDNRYTVLVQTPAIVQPEIRPITQPVIAQPVIATAIQPTTQAAPQPAAAMATEPVAEATPPPLRIAQKVQYDKLVEKVARTYGLDSALLHAVISVESRYRSDAVSRRGAVGLMQLMPRTAKHYGVADPLDPLQNLHGGAKYLRYLLKTYNNDVSLALAAYNSGETAVAKYGNQIPPYRETKQYVPRVLGFYNKYRAEVL